MSVQTEYQKYCSWTRSNTLSEADYNEHLNNVRDQMSFFIEDPENSKSGIVQGILDHLDLQNALVFIRVSKKVYASAQKRWFENRAKEIVLRHVLRGTAYKDYLNSWEGWLGISKLGLKVAGLAFTFFTGAKAAFHESRIPEDAPVKTEIREREDGTTFEITFIDHPDAFEAASYRMLCGTTGLVTFLGSCSSYLGPEASFSTNTNENSLCKDILGSNHAALLQKLISPEYLEWRLVKMRENLISDPPNWQTNSKLSGMVCPLSGGFMLFPVIDECGHCYDYRSVVEHQLSSSAPPLECPLALTKPNTALAIVKFDMAKFNEIQRVLRGG